MQSLADPRRRSVARLSSLITPSPNRQTVIDLDQLNLWICCTLLLLGRRIYTSSENDRFNNDSNNFTCMFYSVIGTVYIERKKHLLPIYKSIDLF
jgi:hypothetical protein